MRTYEKLPAALKALIVFLPEIVVCLLILIQPTILEALLISVASKVFDACPECLGSKQFLLSIALLILCLSFHLIRFFGLQLSGRFLLLDHHPSGQEILIALLVVAGYLVFLVKSLNPNQVPVDAGRLGVFDIIGASAAALTLIVISTSVFYLFVTKEK